MPFLTIGVEHKTSPLNIREGVALSSEAIEAASRALIADAAIQEVAVVTTCNRTELYLFAGEGKEPLADATVRGYLAALDAGVMPYLQTWHGMDVAAHLFRVACGLESQVLGEPQVLSQVRDALEMAQRLETIGPNLHQLFRSAIKCARQARARTALGRVNVSLASEAILAAEQALGSLQGRCAVLIGGGEIAQLVAEELREKAIGSLFVANRTESVAADLARRYIGTAARLDDLPDLIPCAHLVISTTSARQYVLTQEDFAKGTLDNWVAPLQVFDLAIPRDVDPAVGSLPGVVLHDLDSLLPAGPGDRWEEDIREMESIIAGEVQEFLAWTLVRRIVPVIANLRSHVEAVSEQELRRVAPQLTGLTEKERTAVESLTARLIDKMFHHLVIRLRLAAQTDPKLVEAAEFFFLHGEGSLFDHAAGQEASRAPQPGDRDRSLEL